MSPFYTRKWSRNQNLEQDHGHGSGSGSDSGKMIRFRFKFGLWLRTTPPARGGGGGVGTKYTSLGKRTHLWNTPPLPLLELCLHPHSGESYGCLGVFTHLQQKQ